MHRQSNWLLWKSTITSIKFVRPTRQSAWKMCLLDLWRKKEQQMYSLLEVKTWESEHTSTDPIKTCVLPCVFLLFCIRLLWKFRTQNAQCTFVDLFPWCRKCAGAASHSHLGAWPNRYAHKHTHSTVCAW